MFIWYDQLNYIVIAFRVAEEFDINEERNKARHTELLQDLQQEMDTANERGRKSVETHIHQKLRQMEQEFEEQQRHLLQIQDERQEELYARQREELEECMRRQLQQENIGQQQQYLKVQCSSNHFDTILLNFVYTWLK